MIDLTNRVRKWDKLTIIFSFVKKRKNLTTTIKYVKNATVG